MLLGRRFAYVGMLGAASHLRHAPLRAASFETDVPHFGHRYFKKPTINNGTTANSGVRAAQMPPIPAQSHGL